MRFTNNELYHIWIGVAAFVVAIGIPAVKVFGGTEGAAFALELAWLTMASQGVIVALIGSVIGQSIAKGEAASQVSLLQPTKEPENV